METPVLANPVIKEDDPQMAELSRLAAEADANDSVDEGTDSPAQQSEPAEPTNEEGAPEAQGNQPDNSDTKPPAQDRNPDGTFRPKDAQAPPTVDDPNKKPESIYEKAKKEAVRKERTWQQIEAEKQQVRAQAAELAAQRQALIESQQRQAQAARTSPDGRNQYTAEVYRAAAADFKRQAAQVLDDDPDQAKKLLDNADKAELMAQRTAEVETEQYQEGERGKFAQAYDQYVAHEFANSPELQDPQNPIHVKLQHLLQTEPMFQITADGFQKAHRVAQLLRAEDLVSELTDKNKKLEAEVADLRKRTGIKGSGPTSPTSAKRLEDMTPAEQMAHLERITELADQTS